jgi:hypothetical protein
MANLGFFAIDTEGEYVKFSELTGLTLTPGTPYVFQVQGACYFCESATKPTKGGIYINNLKPFGYTARDVDLWVSTMFSSYINIVE